MAGPLVIVGDCLLDRDVVGQVERTNPGAPVPIVSELTARARPGGAGLAAVLAARCRDVLLITALAHDAPGAQLRALLAAAGVEVVDFGLLAATPEKVRIRSQGRTLVRLDFGGAMAAGVPDTVGAPTAEGLAALAGGRAILVSDYGHGITAEPSIRRVVAHAAASVPVVWDPHPRGSPPVPGVQLVKPSRHEAGAGHRLAEVAIRAEQLRRRWRAKGVVITLAEEGALLATADPVPLLIRTPRRSRVDAYGAGDCFAVAAACLLADGAGLAECVAGAVVAASAFVEAGGAFGSMVAHERHGAQANRGSRTYRGPGPGGLSSAASALDQRHRPAGAA